MGMGMGMRSVACTWILIVVDSRSSVRIQCLTLEIIGGDGRSAAFKHSSHFSTIRAIHTNKASRSSAIRT